MKKRVLFGTMILSAILAAPVYAAGTNVKTTEEETTASEYKGAVYDPTEELVLMRNPDGEIYGVPKSAVEVLKEEGYTYYESTETVEEAEDEEVVYDTASEEMYQDIRDQLDNNKNHRAYIDVWTDATNLVIPSDILQKLNELNGMLGVIFDEKTYEEGHDTDPWPEQKYTILIMGYDTVSVDESIDLTSSFDKTDAGYTFSCNADTTLNGMYMAAIYDKEDDDAVPGMYAIHDSAGTQIGEGDMASAEDGLWITFSTLRSGTATRTGDIPETEAYVEETEEEIKEEDILETEAAVEESKSEEEVTNNVEKTSNLTWIYVVAAGICVVLGGIGYYLGKKKKI